MRFYPSGSAWEEPNPSPPLKSANVPFAALAALAFTGLRLLLSFCGGMVRQPFFQDGIHGGGAAKQRASGVLHVLTVRGAVAVVPSLVIPAHICRDGLAQCLDATLKRMVGQHRLSQRKPSCGQGGHVVMILLLHATHHVVGQPLPRPGVGMVKIPWHME